MPSAAFIDQLRVSCRDEAVDVVLIAGDVYDRALPGSTSSAAGRRPGGTDRRRRPGGADQRQPRLGHPARLRLAAAGARGVHLRTRLTELDQPVMFPLDAARPDAGPVLAIYGIPWLEPRLVAEQLGVEPPATSR